VRLLGCPPEADELAKHPEAWTAGLLGSIVEGRSEFEVSEFFFGPLCQPLETARQYRHDALPDHGEAHRLLGRLIASEGDAHRKAAAQMQPGGREAAAARAFLPEDEREARLFLRYYAEAKSALYRAIRAFTAALDRERRGLDPGDDETEPVAPEHVPAAPEPPPVEPAPAPNEPKPVAAVSPNEPTAAAAKSPNEPAKGARRLGSLLTMLDLDAPSSSYVPISATGKPPVATRR
jgi:hypothetical protein